MDAPTSPPPVVVPRWVQLVMLPLAVLGLYTAARAAGDVLLVFTIAGVFALILSPLVGLGQRRLRLPRALAVVAVFLGFFSTLAGAGFLLATPVADQARAFERDVPDLVDEANLALLDVQAFFDRNGVDVEIAAQGETALSTLQERVLRGSGEIVALTGELLRRLVEVGFYLILVIVVCVYMLVYAPRIGALVRSLMPAGDGTPADDYPTRVQRAVFDYVRGQLLFSLIMGSSAGAGLWIMGSLGIFPEGRTYALAFGAWFGLMELVPYVGPLLGAIPALVVALFDDPLTAVWVGLFFTALQQLEGHVVAPQVFGLALRLNPLVVIFALLFGGEVYGFLGALLALPIAAVVRETVVYLRRHLVLEAWGTAPVVVGAAPPGPGAPSSTSPGPDQPSGPPPPTPPPGPDREDDTERLPSMRL